MSAVVVKATMQYLCRHGSVGVFRLVDDLLKLPGVRKSLGFDGQAPRPGTEEWWRAYHAVLDAVRALEGKGLAKYIASMGVVNWLAGRCV